MSPYENLLGLSHEEKLVLAEGDLGRIPDDLWERLCDGCARCCLYKLFDTAGGVIYQTMLACPHLELESCRCTVYAERHQKAANCIVLSPANLSELTWLPETCAYKRVQRGIELPSWHHLVSGSRDTVHRGGHSVKNFAVSARAIAVSDYPYYIIRLIGRHRPERNLTFCR